MKIAFFYSYDKKTGIGHERFERSYLVGEALSKNNHKVSYIEDGVLMSDTDILVIDHHSSQRGMIQSANNALIWTVSINGSAEDVSIASSSMGTSTGCKAKYSGKNYVVVPLCPHWIKYDATKAPKNTVLVAMGMLDKKNYAEIVLSALSGTDINIIVSKSSNHSSFSENFSNVEVVEDESLYDIMQDCSIAVTDGGMEFFQALHFGIPTITLSQDIDPNEYNFCCIPCAPNEHDIFSKISWLIDNEYHKKSLSTFSAYCIDGSGINRVCSIIEDML